MSFRSRWLRGAVVTGAVVPLGIALVASNGSAAPAPRGGEFRSPANAGQFASAQDNPSAELIDRAQQWAQMRTAPGTTVSSLAFAAARAQAAALPQVGASWQELTKRIYASDAKGFRDPFWSNSGLGNGRVSGRTTALAVDGNTVWLGAADGGVWKSTNRGQTWRPVFDNQANLSIGAVSVNPADHSVWVGTGEANTNADAYNGAGIFRSADGGATWQLVGNRLDQYLVSRLSFDGRGFVYAATSRGLLRRSALDLTSPWQVVLKPDPNPANSPYRTSFMTDVKVRPGTNGRVVLAVLGWRGGTLSSDLAYNGLYLSTDRGTTFTKVAPQGALKGVVTGRVTLAYSADGKKLYAVVASGQTATLDGPGGGIYRSDSGSADGPWTLVADSAKLGASGSVYASLGLNVGAQAWYNQDIAVDPRNAAHVYLGLEEVFESTTAGNTWLAVGPYWNYGLPCYQKNPDSCPTTTHPDQHAIALDPATGIGYFGNDGGVYSRRLNYHQRWGWTDLNTTLYTLQYYFAAIGKGNGGDMVWGGLQDNGTSLILPGRANMVQPFGGDGGDNIVDPNNGNRAVNEYVYLNMASTTNAGRSDGTTRSYRTISPSCFNVEFTPNPCDPNPRFIAPFEADPKNVNHWVAGGQYVWDNQGKGWATTCTSAKNVCDWKIVRDTGAGNSITAIATVGNVTYAGWCGTGNSCNPGLGIPFSSGIDTNYGGTWHRVSAPNLPDRMVTDLVVDPAQPGHVVATYGAFSRRWIPNAGTGHVFESWNGGATWTDLSGNLPDAPASAAQWWRGQLVVGTDVGVFVQTSRGRWARLGSGMPNAATNDLVISPSTGYLLAATHGRGLWTLAR